MKRLKHVAVAALGASLLSIGAAAPAQAAVTDCLSGQICIWHDLSYTGLYARAYDNLYLSASSYNKATSVASNGNTNCGRFWDNPDNTGPYIYFSRPALGGIYRDPDLQNGGGYGPYNSQNWNDRITEGTWQTC